MAQPDDDVVLVVPDEAVGEPRARRPAFLLVVPVVVLVLLVVLVSGGSPSHHGTTYPAIKMAPGRTVGDDTSLAEAYAGKRALRAFEARGVAAHRTRLRSTCRTTNPHDLGGGQSWDCDVRARLSRLVVHVREDAAGVYTGELSRGR